MSIVATIRKRLARAEAGVARDLRTCWMQIRIWAAVALGHRTLTVTAGEVNWCAAIGISGRTYRGRMVGVSARRIGPGRWNVTFTFHVISRPVTSRDLAEIIDGPEA
jgi:hypothetical protein